MFTKEQREILLKLRVYTDTEVVDSRKGRAQVIPRFTIKGTETYWCPKAEEVLQVPKELIGTWILELLCDEDYCEFSDFPDADWVLAEEKEFVVKRWVAK